MPNISTRRGRVVPYEDVPNKDLELGFSSDSAYKKSPYFFLNQKKDTRVLDYERRGSRGANIPQGYADSLRKVANSPSNEDGLYFPINKVSTKEEQQYKGIPMINTWPGAGKNEKENRNIDETVIHENAHSNQDHNINKRGKGLNNRTLRKALSNNEYLKGLKRQGYNMDRNTYKEQLGYYAQRDARASDPRQTMNELRSGWKPRAWWQDHMGETDPYYTYLSEVHGGAYMLPREPSILERLQDAIAKARQ